MKDWWLKLGCFLTGYNYNIVRLCSEVTAKEVKRYASALVIVCILWAFIGYSFTSRYLQADLIGSIFGSVILVVIIIQIERQIILTLNPSRVLYLSRALIAFTMSLIGSIIIDQIILKEDIEHKKKLIIDEKVNRLLPSKAAELKIQIAQLDSALRLKEYVRDSLQAGIVRNPMIQSITVNSSPVVVSNTTIDSNNNKNTTQKVVNASNITRTSIPNPNIELVKQMDAAILGLRNDKAKKDSSLLLLRPSLEKELLSQKGFLDELDVMYRLVSESGVALLVWLLWVFIILGIELFVLISKVGEKTNDYQAMVKHQMEMHLQKLRLLDPSLSLK